MSAFTIGTTATMTVGIVGQVTASGEGWVEINGLRLPTMLAAQPGACYLSTELPSSNDHFDADECDSCDDWRRQLDTVETEWAERIRNFHDIAHAGSWRFCDDALCREVADR